MRSSTRLSRFLLRLPKNLTKKTISLRIGENEYLRSFEHEQKLWLFHAPRFPKSRHKRHCWIESSSRSILPNSFSVDKIDRKWRNRSSWINLLESKVCWCPRPRAIRWAEATRDDERCRGANWWCFLADRPFVFKQREKEKIRFVAESFELNRRVWRCFDKKFLNDELGKERWARQQIFSKENRSSKKSSSEEKKSLENGDRSGVLQRVVLVELTFLFLFIANDFDSQQMSQRTESQRQRNDPESERVSRRFVLWSIDEPRFELVQFLDRLSFVFDFIWISELHESLDLFAKRNQRSLVELFLFQRKFYSFRKGFIDKFSVAI